MIRYVWWIKYNGTQNKMDNAFKPFIRWLKNIFYFLNILSTDNIFILKKITQTVPND